MKFFGTLMMFLAFIYPVTAQFTGINIIDESDSTAGIQHMNSFDVDLNGSNDLIVAQGNPEDKLAVYKNSGNANFTLEIIDANIDDPVFINYGDFNANGWVDIIVVTESNGEIFLYENSAGNFQTRVLLGTVQSFGKSLAVADFDVDGDLDFVAIGQHSIDLYRNDGNANFSMENILTTSSSPNILECFSMACEDLNGDGFQDVVTAETIGIVAYINDGNANFTPQTVSEASHSTVKVINTFDANGNGQPDLLFHSFSEAGVYLNQSTTSSVDYAYHDELFTATNGLKEFRPGDFILNGGEDIFYADMGSAFYIENLTGLQFSAPIELYSDSELFIWETLLADITGDGNSELIWAAAGGTIAYHQLESSGVLSEDNSFSIYPNPSNGIFKFSSQQSGNIEVFNVQGEKVYENSILPGTTHHNLSELTSGIYSVKFVNSQGTQVSKLVVK